MAQTARAGLEDPRQKIEVARQKVNAEAIEPPRTRRYRAAAFQTYVLVAAASFVTLAVIAHTVAYFPLDLRITRFVQHYHGAWFAHLMYGVSWIGFMPQVYLLVLSLVGLMFLAGIRWEAIAALIAASGVWVGTLVKLIVYRPRPSADLINVFVFDD